MAKIFTRSTAACFVDVSVMKSPLIKSVVVSKWDTSDEFGSHAILQVAGYDIEIKRKSYNTIDEAVSGIKERIVAAIKGFDGMIKEAEIKTEKK